MENIIEIIQNPIGKSLELKPCPFCGHSDGVAYVEYEHAAGPRWKVMCLGCAAEIDPGYAQQRYTVQEMWNKRA